METITEWAMFTAGGNAALTRRAETCLKRIEAAPRIDGYPDYRRVKAALLAFVASWMKMWNTAKYGEAGDTAVREIVESFFNRVVTASTRRDSTTDTWYRFYDDAYARVHTKRRRDV